MGMKNRFRLRLKTPRAAASKVRRAVAASIESLESRTLFDGIVGPVDNIPPAASIVPPAQVTTYRGSSETIEVYFFDNADVNVYSITPANLTVEGPGGNSLA